MKWFAPILVVLVLISQSAHAVCSSPAGSEGDAVYNTTYNVPQYCDGSDNWIAMVGESPFLQPSSGLVGYWKLDESSGVFVDLSLTGGDGTASGGVGYNPTGGIIDGAAQITTDTSTTAINAGSDPAFDLTSGSVSFWFRTPNNNYGTDRYIFAKDAAANNSGDFAVYLEKNGGLSDFFRFRITDSGGTNRFISADSLITSDTWYHVVVTFGTVMKMYVNGVQQVETYALTLGMENTAANVILANARPGTGVFMMAGDMLDDVRIYNRVLSGSEVLGIYNLKMAVALGPDTQIVPSGLVGHWRLDETSGTTAYDTSGNGYDGTISGTTAAAATFSGQVTSAFNFDGVNDRVRIAPTGLNLGSSFSASFWLKRTNNDGFNNRHILDIRELGASAVLAFRAGASDVQYRDTTGTLSGSLALNYPTDNVWHHYSISYDGTNIVIYFDGTEYSSTPLAGFTLNNINLIDFSDCCNSINHFEGALDDVRLYSRDLDADEVATIYHARDGIHYNEINRVPEFFDGNRFVAMPPPFPDVIDSTPIYDYCLTIGDLCDDGSVYAGPASNGERLYVTASDQGSYIWKGSIGTNDISTDSTVDGRINVANLNSAIANFPAINRCDSVSPHSKGDWYLPSEGELVLLNNNRAAIEANAAAFGSGAYWSSTELTSNVARRRYFDSATTNQIDKTNSHPVRCVRRGELEIIGWNGLVGHWKLDETIGTTAVDSSGNGNDGTLQNGLDAANDNTVGAVGRSLSFDGVNDAIALPEFPLDDITIAVWMKTTNTAVEQFPVNIYGSGSDGWGLHVVAGNIALKDDIDNADADHYSATIENNRWHHVVISMTSGLANSMYVDGALIGTGALSSDTVSSIAGSGPDLAIGARYSTGNLAFKGGLDDVRIYDRTLSVSEIQKLYNMGAPVGSSTALPQGCPTIGDVCDDGTIYAGLSPDGNVAMFAAPEDASGNYTWNDGNTDYTITSATSTTAGAANTNTIVTVDSDGVTGGFQPHNAAQACYDLVQNGADDWYLPAQDELNVLYTNRDSGALGGTFIPQRYWSSSELSNVNAIRQNFGNGNQSAHQKELSFSVRCVRKGSAPRCANPYGLEGSMIYNTSFDVVQYCDGARWIAIGKTQ